MVGHSCGLLYHSLWYLSVRLSASVTVETGVLFFYTCLIVATRNSVNHMSFGCGEPADCTRGVDWPQRRKWPSDNSAAGACSVNKRKATQNITSSLLNLCIAKRKEWLCFTVSRNKAVSVEQREERKHRQASGELTIRGALESRSLTVTCRKHFKLITHEVL